MAITKVPQHCCGVQTVSNKGLLGKMCTFVSVTVKQSGENRELQRPSTIAAVTSSRGEDGKQPKKTRQRQAAVTEIACMRRSLKLQSRCVQEIKENLFSSWNGQKNVTDRK